MSACSDDREIFDEGPERESVVFGVERYLEIDPAIKALLRLHDVCQRLDEGYGHSGENVLSRRFLVESVGNASFRFRHHRITMHPKRNAIALTGMTQAPAQLVLIFPVDRDNRPVNTMFIRKLDQRGEWLSEEVITPTACGEYNETVEVHMGADHYFEMVTGVTDDPDFDGWVFDAQLKDYEPDLQLNHPPHRPPRAA